ncbi:MAG: hypothetical protein PHE38_06345 [Alishewanella agri]|nr:hypothetical protein [Alishewanella agri]
MEKEESLGSFVGGMFDYFKHLSTLNSGAILIVLALANNLSNAKVDIESLYGSVFAFCGALIASVLAMAVLASHKGAKSLSERAIKMLGFGMAASGIGFCGGILLVAIQALKITG